MSLPQNILEASERLLEYHRSSKLDERTPAPAPDVRTKPAMSWLFDFADKTPLASSLIDLPTGVLPLLTHGLEALPQSMHSPPQDLRTLSTWLHMAAGNRQRVATPWGQAHTRGVASVDLAYCDEIYVAAFAIDGLEPGFYHYSPREHALRKLRDVAEALSMLRRGRPDLQFLATIPCALLVSTVFSRSSWLHGRRGYRKSVIEAGQMVANLHAVAMALGMSTHVRLRMTDSCMRELIGLPEDYDYASAEAVQSMLAWTDGAHKPLEVPPRPPPGALYTIPRPVSGKVPVPFGSIIAAHRDACAVGVAIREIHPPMTDLTPVPSSVNMQRLAVASEDVANRSLRSVLLQSQVITEFKPRPLSRNAMARIVQCAFRGGTFFPLKPEGAHVALVRPFWVMQDIVGFEPGIWWYDPVIDHWVLLNRGQYRTETGVFTRQKELLAGASAVCVMVANLRVLLGEAGPDLYRLSLLEAGVAAQRLSLAACSVGMASLTFADFADDLWRGFLGLGSTGWEPLAVCAIGGAPDIPGKTVEPMSGGSSLEFRD
ncbi:MAG: SagB family peptide dehydrogenase [Burkholderiales bacterium]|nr:SagB family peptide dehydrogenase [Phycisphaerae bacterium]